MASRATDWAALSNSELVVDRSDPRQSQRTSKAAPVTADVTRTGVAALNSWSAIRLADTALDRNACAGNSRRNSNSARHGRTPLR
jgi:hypothetical protein